MQLLPKVTRKKHYMSVLLTYIDPNNRARRHATCFLTKTTAETGLYLP